MGESRIEWTEKVWNPVTGCTKISPGCAHCYAERMAKRLRGRCGYPADDPFRVTFHPERLEEPLHWRKPRLIFVCSMGDLFHEDVPDEWINMIFAAMTHPMCGGTHHKYLILTKRPERILAGHAERFAEWPNLWLGVTAENQEMADKRIPILLQIPAVVHFVSVEPMIGPVDLNLACANSLPWNDATVRPKGKFAIGRAASLLDWVICGCESGPNRRPAKIDDIRSLRDQCVSASVPFFLKQMEVDGQVVKMPELDGRAWDQTPGEEDDE